MVTLEVWVDIKSMNRDGKSIRAIARELAISRNTVRRYLRSGGPPLYVRVHRRASLLDPYKDYLQKRLGKKPGIKAPVLLREIRAQGYTGGLTILKDYLRPHREEQRRLASLTVRYETEPGEQAQFDWSGMGQLPDGRRLYGISTILGYSRFQFVVFTVRIGIAELLWGLVEAFKYYGGVPRKLLVDNDKRLVLKRGKTTADSMLHPRFADLLGHYGLGLRLCRIRRAQTKGKIERPFSYIWDSLVMPCIDDWTGPDQANRDGRQWLDQVANVRIHGTTNRRPIDMLPEEQLAPLDPRRPFDVSWVEARRVFRDCCFSWEGNRYSVPWQYGGTSILVRQFPDGRLQIERDGQIIAHHTECEGQGETIILPDHVSGLWSRTLKPPLAADRHPGRGTDRVQERDLRVYQAFLEGTPL